MDTDKPTLLTDRTALTSTNTNRPITRQENLQRTPPPSAQNTYPQLK